MIQDIEEGFKKKERQIHEVLDLWKEGESKKIDIKDIVPEDFDGEIAEKQVLELSKILEDMNKNTSQMLKLASGILMQISKIEEYKGTLQSQIKQLNLGIDSRNSKIRSISRELLK